MLDLLIEFKELLLAILSFMAVSGSGLYFAIKYKSSNSQKSNNGSINVISQGDVKIDNKSKSG